MYDIVNMVFVRHGESLANVWIKEGNIEARRNTVTSRIPLSSRGRKQAARLSAYLHDSFGQFHAFAVSPYRRALETAALLRIPNASWSIVHRLRERDRGDVQGCSVKRIAREFPQVARERTLDPLNWRPPNGETIAEVAERLEPYLKHAIRERQANERALIICHRDVMWAARVLFEAYTPKSFHELVKAEHIPNAGILAYQITRNGSAWRATSLTIHAPIRDARPRTITIEPRSYANQDLERTFDQEP